MGGDVYVDVMVETDVIETITADFTGGHVLTAAIAKANEDMVPVFPMSDNDKRKYGTTKPSKAARSCEES